MAARKRRTRIPKPRHLPAATAAANAAGRVLIEHYGEQPWILQAMEAVRGGIERCHEQLNRPAMPGNMDTFANGAGYQLPPRTAEEIKADMAARRAARTPQQIVEVLEEDMGDQDDLFARLSRTAQTEVPILEHEENEDAGAVPRDDSDSMPWVF